MFISKYFLLFFEHKELYSLIRILDYLCIISLVYVNPIFKGACEGNALQEKKKN